MANLRDLRLRTRAVQQTLQVTKAMNLISTSKLRKGRRLLEDSQPFFIRIQKAMYDILSGAKNVGSRYLDVGITKTQTPAGRQVSAQEKPKRSAILVITSDKGLAGGYNANIFREVISLCKKLSKPEESADGGKSKIPQGGSSVPILILIGTIGYRYFINSPYLIMENFSFHSRMPDMDNAQEIADFVVAQYLWGMFDEIFIVYTHMHSAVKLIPTIKQILPIREEKLQEEITKYGLEKRVSLNFEYHPSEEEVFDALVPMYINGIIYGCLIESYASEQSARMSAMDEASKSAEEMLGSLQLQYNHIRQAGITQEITEIVSGSSVLN